MAIDTRTKRLSMLNFSIGALLPDPSGTIDAGDRLTLLDLYRGIAALAAVDRTPVVFVAQGHAPGAVLAQGHSPGAETAQGHNPGAQVAEGVG